jgi:hypothetical protein
MLLYRPTAVDPATAAQLEIKPLFRRTEIRIETVAARCRVALGVGLGAHN